MSFQSLSEFHKGWIVGLLEGEGCFRPSKVQLKMTDKDVVETYMRLLGFEAHYALGGYPSKTGHKTAYMCQAYGERARQLMADLKPHMHERRRAKIEEVLGGG